MSVSTPLPNVSSAQMLARQQGQTVEARVLGPQQDGSTQVQVGRQTLSLQLPTQPPVGTTLTLAVQQVEGQVRLSLLTTTPPSSVPQAQAALPTDRGAVEAPATRVQLSPLAQNVNQAPPVQSSGGAPVSPVTTQPTTANPPPTNYAPPHAQYSNPQAGGRPDAPPQTQPVAAAVPTAVRANVPYQAPAAPFVAAVNNGGAAQLGERPPQGMSTGGQFSTQAGLGGTARAEGVQANLPQSSAPPPVSTQNSPASQAAVAQMVTQALPRQDSVAGLTTVLASVVGRVPLPRDVTKAAQDVLQQQLNFDADGVDPLALKQAVRQSGVMHETLLSSGNAQAAGGDMKAALMGLQRQLGAFLGGEGAGIERVSQLPPPLKGLQPRVRPSKGALENLPKDPVELGKVLLERTEASLARLRLHQGASLPEPGAARHDHNWSMELPVQVAGQHSVLNLQIHGEPQSEQDQPEDRGWQVRFALHLADRGEVGAQLSLRGKRTSVLIWADNEDMGAQLKAHVEELQAELERVGLLPGAMIIRVGAPAGIERAQNKHYLDATT